jgi:hypothetical protein
MSSVEARRRYCAWLLRCWQARGQGSEPLMTWRYSLEDPHSGARRGFASFEALVAHLRAELGLDGDAGLEGAALAPGRAGDAGEQ